MASSLYFTGRVVDFRCQVAHRQRAASASVLLATLSVCQVNYVALPAFPWVWPGSTGYEAGVSGSLPRRSFPLRTYTSGVLTPIVSCWRRLWWMVFSPSVGWFTVLHGPRRLKIFCSAASVRLRWCTAGCSSLCGREGCTRGGHYCSGVLFPSVFSGADGRLMLVRLVPCAGGGCWATSFLGEIGTWFTLDLTRKWRFLLPASGGQSCLPVSFLFALRRFFVAVACSLASARRSVGLLLDWVNSRTLVLVSLRQLYSF